MCTRLVLSFGPEHLYDVHVRDVVKKLVELGKAPSYCTEPFGGFIREESIASWAPKFVRRGNGTALQLRFPVSSIVEAGKRIPVQGEAVMVLVDDSYGVSWKLITMSAAHIEGWPADSRGFKRIPYGLESVAPKQLTLGLQTA